METTILNFIAPGDRVALFANGYFCDRIGDIASRNGAEVVRCEKPWGEWFEDAEAEEFIARVKPQVVAYVQAETSTGVFQDGRAICRAAHDAGAIVIADCVTSLGGMPVRVDDTGIDAAFSGTQKCLSCPPGLSPITVNERAMAKLRARPDQVRSFYFDLRLLDEYYNKSHRFHHTAPISMFYALREALAAIAEEGLEARFERHRANHLALVEALKKMGLEMLVTDPSRRLWTLHTVKVPAGADDAGIRKRLLQEHGIEISGGFGPLAGKIFRIGLMGTSSTRENIDRLLAALSKAL
jgi:alanine-glyoxylate transaminase/serine-glyoxylate transaminase/serine-pyruvate transaminase